ncbi:MAG: potassium channel family protein [Pseudomonadota bacterium]|nr:potassium channel family protein [Pseudomonadota bacterium]
MGWLMQLAGAGLILLALLDVFLTVLYARSGAGLITPRLNRLTWRLIRRAAPRSRAARDKFLSFAGPAMLVLTVAVWAILLFLGSGLIAWPELGTGLRATQGATPTDFLTALYYGGYSLTTLGTGDIVPTTGAMKVLMVLQALVGFSFVTLTLTYFISVYSALLRRNKLWRCAANGSRWSAPSELGGYRWDEISAAGEPTESVWKGGSAEAIRR